MKKFNTLFVLLLIVSMGFAQVTISPKQISSEQINSKRISLLRDTNVGLTTVQDAEKMQFVPNEQPALFSDEFEAVSFVDLPSAVKTVRSLRNNLTVWYAPPTGTLFQGFSRNFYMFNQLRLHTPAFTPVIYTPLANQAGTTFTWTFANDANTPIDSDFVGANGVLSLASGISRAGTTQAFALPKATATVGSTTASYVLGQNVVAGRISRGAYVGRTTTNDGTAFTGRQEFTPLTLANLWFRQPNNANALLDLNGFAFTSTVSNANGPVRAFKQIIPRLVSPLYVESMSILAYSTGTTVPAGGVLRMELFYLNNDGSLGERIGGATTSQFVPTLSATQGVFAFDVRNNPIVIGTEADVAVVISGFNATWNFGIYVGQADPGHSFRLHGDNLVPHTIVYQDTNIPAVEMYIQFNAIFNCLMPVDNSVVVKFPANGGWGITGTDEAEEYTNSYYIHSSFNFADVLNDVGLETPDWVDEVRFNAELFDDQNILMLFFSAEALPAGVFYRSGEVTLSLYGVSMTIPVVQERAWVAVTNITDVPTSATIGVPLPLTGTVNPENATFQNIVWSIANAGTTGAMIIGNDFFAISSGNALITATIEDGVAMGTNYTQGFFIAVSEQETSLTTLETNPLRAWTQNGLLHISGLTFGEMLNIYSVTGTLVYQGLAVGSEIEISLNMRGVYVIHSGGNTIKVVL